PGQPGGEAGVAAVAFPVPEPAELMLVAQHQGDIARGALRADAARPLVRPGGQPGRAGNAQEIGLQLAVPLRLAPQLQVSRAQIAMARLRPFTAGDQAVPAVDRMAGRDRDDLRAEKRVKRRRADQRGQDLQPVPARPVIPHGKQRGHGHVVSPHTARSAASKAGSRRSACPYTSSTVAAEAQPPASRAISRLPPAASRTAEANECRNACGLITPIPARLPARASTRRAASGAHGWPARSPCNWTSSIGWPGRRGYSVVTYSK